MKSPVASPPCMILVAMRPAKSFWLEGVGLVQHAPECLPANQLVEARHDDLLARPRHLAIMTPSADHQESG